MKKRRMCIPLLMLFMLLLVGTFVPSKEVNAATIVYSGTSGSLNWSIDDTGHLLITGTGDYAYYFDERGWTDYVDLITSATVKVKGITSCKDMFADHPNLVTVDLSQSDLSNVTDMTNMFSVCDNLEKVTFGKNCNTSNVTSMLGMFYSDTDFVEADFENLDTDSVETLNFIFGYCYSLEYVDLSSFDTSNVTDMSLMFEGCCSLKEVDLSGFITSKVTSTYKMFSKCTSLIELDISHFDMSNVVNAEDMFIFTKSIGRLYAPKNVKIDIALAEEATFKTASGTVYTKLPKNQSKSILLLNIGEPKEVITKDSKQIVVDDKGVRIATTGLVKVGGKYYYVKDGVVQKVTTLVKNGSEYWYVKDGVFAKTTALIKYNNTYYYVKDGIHAKVTTLVNYNNKYWYVKNGILCKDTTLVKYGSNYWYVSGGTVQKVTTLVKYGDKYYYVQNGKHVKATGLTKYGNDYWYVKNGVVSKETTIVKQGGKYYLVYRGKWHRTYNGTYVWNGVRWKIVKGVVTGRA